MNLLESLIRYLARKLNVKKHIRDLKQPKMYWGYTTQSGQKLDKVRISDTVYMYHEENIVFNNNVFVWHYTILDGTGGLYIGEGTQIGAWVGIFTHSSHLAIRLYGHEYTRIPEMEKKAYPISPVNIGKFVFIGAGAKILPGVEIGDYAIVSAGAIVSKNIPKYAIAKGNPAEIIGDVRKLDAKYLEKYPELEQSYVIRQT